MDISDNIIDIDADLNFCFIASARPNVEKVFLGTKCYGASYPVDKAQEICDKLQKVINKAKNKDGKK